MSSKITIQKQTGESNIIITNGFLILYFEPGDEQIKVMGDIDVKAITPLLTKVVLAHFGKKMGI